MGQSLHQRVQDLLSLHHFEHLKVRPYATWSYETDKDTSCVAIVMDELHARSWLTTIRMALPEGLVAFLGTNNAARQMELVIAEGRSQFDILRIARCRMGDSGLETDEAIEQVTAKLREYDAQFGINIVGASSDTVEFVLYTLPSDLMAFAEDVYDFCADVEAASTVAASVETWMRVSLWWD